MKRKESANNARSLGSKRYLQALVNTDKRYINRLLLKKCPSLGTWREPIWVSPLFKDNYREYQDNDFLKYIDQVSLRKKLREFWPAGGPYWDALARVERKNGERGVILAEAKANIPELSSPSYDSTLGVNPLRLDFKQG